MQQSARRGQGSAGRHLSQKVSPFQFGPFAFFSHDDFPSPVWNEAAVPSLYEIKKQKTSNLWSAFHENVRGGTDWLVGVEGRSGNSTARVYWRAVSIADALDKNYARLERQLRQVAEAMPADKYSFRPTPEVRSFGEQLRHIAAVQWVVGAGILGEKPPADVGDGDSGPFSMTAKHEILKYALDSFVYIRRAIKSIHDADALEMIPHPYDPANIRMERLVLIAGYASHGWEHYGQMVVYQRMNGIVPPPSRSD